MALRNKKQDVQDENISNIVNFQSPNNNTTLITHEESHDLAMLIDLLALQLTDLRKKIKPK